jgi:hypothetical protein
VHGCFLGQSSCDDGRHAVFLEFDKAIHSALLIRKKRTRRRAGKRVLIAESLALLRYRMYRFCRARGLGKVCWRTQQHAGRRTIVGLAQSPLVMTALPRWPRRNDNIGNPKDQRRSHDDDDDGDYRNSWPQAPSVGCLHIGRGSNNGHRVSDWLRCPHAVTVQLRHGLALEVPTPAKTRGRQHIETWIILPRSRPLGSESIARAMIRAHREFAGFRCRGLPDSELNRIPSRRWRQPVGGNGFSCVILRRSVLAQTVLQHVRPTPDCDPNLYHWLSGTPWKARIDWRVECEHRGTAGIW